MTTVKARTPSYVDEEHWYKIQNNFTWYVIKACCRNCATRKLHEWLNNYGTPGTGNPYPKWLVRL